ncbi:MAG TPA: hypothetical protein VIX73_23565 [Kofleriaceae bacterium]
MMAPSSRAAPPVGEPVLPEPRRGVESAFRDAVTDSVERLELCDKNLITFHYFHGLGVDQLSEMFAIPRAGMVRQLARIRERLLRDIRRGLAARLPLDRLRAPSGSAARPGGAGACDRAELDRLLELARRRFDLVITRVLRA